MKGDSWVDIRANRQKGLKYTEIGRKYGIKVKHMLRKGHIESI